MAKTHGFHKVVRASAVIENGWLPTGTPAFHQASGCCPVHPLVGVGSALYPRASSLPQAPAFPLCRPQYFHRFQSSRSSGMSKYHLSFMDFVMHTKETTEFPYVTTFLGTYITYSSANQIVNSIT
jgi:hypothetical protein